MKEADLKRTVQEYLQIKSNQGVIYADRLNSGTFVVDVGTRKERIIQGCKSGTADFYFIQRTAFVARGGKSYVTLPYCRVVYIECKGEGGKQSPEQQEFEQLVKAQGAEYHVVRDVDEVEQLVEG